MSLNAKHPFLVTSEMPIRSQSNKYTTLQWRIHYSPISTIYLVYFSVWHLPKTSTLCSSGSSLCLQSESSPFVERLLKKGYEVVYLTEPVDEYCIQALPEFDGKRFQNVAKEGIKFDESEKAKGKREELEKDFEPLTTWLKEKSLKDKVGDPSLSRHRLERERPF